MASSFDQRLEELGEECPVCEEPPVVVFALGPDDIRLGPCGHTFSV